MAEQIEFICVTCPVGCPIQASVESGALVAVQGATCKRGEAFVREELSAPKRMLTTTVRVRGGQLPLLPVHSSAPLPKAMLREVAALMRQVEIEAPITEGQVVAADVLSSGVDMVASRPLSVG